MEEFACSLDIGDEQLRLCTDNRRFGWRRFHLVRRGGKSSFQGLPTIEAVLSCDHFLRIAELKVRRKNLRVAHIQETRNQPADLRGDGIVAFAVPTQYELSLLFEVL